MFREITVDRPIEKVMEDWDFLDEKIVGKFTMFRTVGQNIYGVRRRGISAGEILDPRKGNIADSLELGPTGIVPFEFRPMHLHVTTAGTPHRVPHSMGFWHLNDMDELYLPLPNPEGDALGHFIVIMQTPKGRQGESVAWYCEQCLTLLYERYHCTGTYGLEGVFKSSASALREYNADPKLRTCPECGHLNPLGYAWNPAKDTPAERAARELW
jgi:hypothetical protein